MEERLNKIATWSKNAWFEARMLDLKQASEIHVHHLYSYIVLIGNALATNTPRSLHTTSSFRPIPWMNRQALNTFIYLHEEGVCYFSRHSQKGCTIHSRNKSCSRNNNPSYIISWNGTLHVYSMLPWYYVFIFIGLNYNALEDSLSFFLDKKMLDTYITTHCIIGWQDFILHIEEHEFYITASITKS